MGLIDLVRHDFVFLLAHLEASAQEELLWSVNVHRAASTVALKVYSTPLGQY